MTQVKLALEDLKPAESTFSLYEKSGKVYTLKKFTLADQIWAKRTFGDRLGEIFEKVDLPGIAELAHHLLKDKTDFPDFLTFAENIVTQEDKIGLIKALLTTIGVSQPVIQKLEEAEKHPNG